jgi:hypothetical protein
MNFAAVDRFLAAPGGTSTVTEVNRVTRTTTRFLLRRNAAEENAWIFENWEWIQIFFAAAYFFLILLGDRHSEAALLMVLGMLAIVIIQRFYLSPEVISLGRELAETTNIQDNAMDARFGLFHGLYSGSEILKLLLGLTLGIRLIFHRRDPDRFAKEHGLAISTERAGAEGRGLPRPIR